MASESGTFELPPPPLQAFIRSYIAKSAPLCLPFDYPSLSCSFWDCLQVLLLIEFLGFDGTQKCVGAGGESSEALVQSLQDRLESEFVSGEEVSSPPHPHTYAPTTRCPRSTVHPSPPQPRPLPRSASAPTPPRPSSSPTRRSSWTPRAATRRTPSPYAPPSPLLTQPGLRLRDGRRIGSR